jgi:methylthioribulose-1-phosphate dehydratase
MKTEFADAAARLIKVGQRFDARGWVLGTSGNFSLVMDDEPLRLAITRSGTHKGELTASDIMELDADGLSVGTTAGIPSAETRLHLEVIAARPVRSVLHTHSTWSTLVSDRFAPRGGVAIQGYEMLKGLAGVTTHEYREWIPIVENDQDMPRLAAKIGETLQAHPECHAFLLRRHGLYTWGATLPEAVRHVEIVEFLLESIGRKEAASWRS